MTQYGIPWRSSGHQNQSLSSLEQNRPLATFATLRSKVGTSTRPKQQCIRRRESQLLFQTFVPKYRIYQQHTIFFCRLLTGSFRSLLLHHTCIRERLTYKQTEQSYRNESLLNKKTWQDIILCECNKEQPVQPWKKMKTKTEHITTYNTDNDEIDGMEMHVSINAT